MRVLIELFDKDPIENVLGACVFQPELVVFLCDKRDVTLAKEKAVLRLFRRRRLKTQARFLYLDATNLVQVRHVLAAVMRDFPDCVFDFSGGRDLLLLQAGSTCLAYGAPAYFIDLPRGRFINIQRCEKYETRFQMPHFSADDIFTLSGAAITGSGHFEQGDLDEEFMRDVFRVWQLVQRNTKAWGAFVAWLQACCTGTALETLSVSSAKSMQAERSRVKHNPVIMEKLHALGLLTQYADRGNQVQFTFKSALHKKCLLNQGVWLELYCYAAALRDGVFDEVRTSIVVDWAGAEGGPDSTKNEVDVFLVKGIVPVFVSCKMSAPSPLALSEIRLLSAKFGGALSRTAVVTAARLGNEHKSLRTRAQDLGIALFDITSIERGELAGRLALLAMEGQL